MAIAVVHNADGSLTFATTSLGPITATATNITIAGQFTLPVAPPDPRIATGLADAKLSVTAAQKVVTDLS